MLNDQRQQRDQIDFNIDEDDGNVNATRFVSSYIQEESTIIVRGNVEQSDEEENNQDYDDLFNDNPVPAI